MNLIKLVLQGFRGTVRHAPLFNLSASGGHNIACADAVGFVRAASGSPGKQMAVVSKQSVEEVLTRQLEPHILKVEDTSGGCGTAFSVFVVSEKFEGKPLIQRHRLVNDALKKELTSMHALQIKTLTPSQWESENSGG